MRRIAITCELPKEVAEKFSREFDVLFLSLKPLASAAEAKSLAAQLVDCEALVIAPPFAVDRSLIDELPSSIKALATYSVGYDHLEIPAIKARGLSVLHTPDVLTDAVAEIALLLTLGAARRVTESERLLRGRHWSGWTPTQLVGQGLTDKVMGIYGYGRIGKATAIRARAFGMRVCFHDSRHKAVGEDEFASLVSDEQEFLRSCDVLVMAAPLNPKTRYFLDTRRLKMMKSSAIVINIGRGDLVRDDDLIRALRNEQIFAAGLDVFSNEPIVDGRYFDLPNVFMLPHIGSSTMEARVMMGMKIIDGLIDFFSGRIPTNLLA